MELRSDARDSSTSQRTSVAGTATWRLERDTLDWRRKVTVRLALDGMDSVSCVITTASQAAPGAMLHRTSAPLSHSDPAYYTVSMSARESGKRWTYGSWGFDDTLSFAPLDSPLVSGTVLRGRLFLNGVHSAPSAYEAAGRRRDRAVSRTVDVTFAAAFDPRPDPRPPAMTRTRQQRILWSALEEFAERWVGGGVNPPAVDSTRDNRLGRAFLDRRWSDAAIVDSIAVRPDSFYVRMRGRIVPVTCTVSSRMSHPDCPR